MGPLADQVAEDAVFPTRERIHTERFSQGDELGAGGVHPSVVFAISSAQHNASSIRGE